MVTMGFQAGMVMANFLRRSIDTYEYTSFFNYTGTISLAFTAIFYFFSYNHPSLHSSISPSEVTHLRNSGAPYSFPPIGINFDFDSFSIIVLFNVLIIVNVYILYHILS